MAYQSTWSEVLAYRLNRHHLLDGEADQPDPALICGNLCGVQAQVQSAAEMALGIRNSDLVLEDLRTALWEERTLVKTSCMRQALHLIRARDFPIFIGALKESRRNALLKILSRFDLGPKAYDQLIRLVSEAVSGSEPVPRREITERIKKNIGKSLMEYVDKVWEIQLYRPALVEGVICYGPRDGNRVTYVRAEQWLSGVQQTEPEPAKRELLVRYLKTYGPASPQDFSKWSGMPMREVSGIWGSESSRLDEVAIDGEQLFLPADELDTLSDSRFEEQVINLLPAFDPYLLGHIRTETILPPEHYKKVYRNQGWISPVVLLNGKIIGIWSYENTKSAERIMFTVELFGSKSEELEKRVELAAERLGAFHGASVDLNYA